MALKTCHVLIALFLLFMMLLNTVQSEAIKYPFKSIQNLRGSGKGQSIAGLRAVKQYLMRFGYLNYDLSSEKDQNHASSDVFDDLLESAIKTYQQKFHLKVTGSLDNHTVNQMMMPRCGVADIFNDVKNYNGSKSFEGVSDYTFFAGNPKWTKTQLTYKFHRTFQVPGTENIRSVLKEAFEKWAQVTDFAFQEVPDSSDSDIVIAFYRRDHGDGQSFDGPHGIFAHAFRPTIGRLHYDADETWSSTSPGPLELDLESVSVHEIGHLLGLRHSEDHPEAIMYPYFKYGITKRNLQTDDIRGIRALYGLN